MNTNYARKWESSSAAATSKQQQVVVKVGKQSWITKGEKVLYSIVAATLIITCAFVVSFSSATYTLNKDVQTLEGAVQIQQKENALLVYEMEKLSLPERITKIAKENGLKIQDAEIKHAQGFKK